MFRVLFRVLLFRVSNMEREGQKMVPYFLILRTFSLQISLLSGRREEEGRSAF